MLRIRKPVWPSPREWPDPLEPSFAAQLADLGKAERAVYHLAEIEGEAVGVHDAADGRQAIIV